MMAQALLQSREATLDPAASGPAVSGLPKVQLPNVMRWAGWVRTFLGLQALLEPLVFDVPEPVRGKDEPRGKFKARLLASRETQEASLFFLDQPSKLEAPSVTFTLKPVAALSRPPHSTFEAQIPQVLDWAELRSERTGEILSQIDNQYPFFGLVVPLHNGRMPHTADLVELVIQFAVFVESRFKHELNCWRPVDLSPQIQPMLTTPGHGAYPSGHCTQAYATAHVLSCLLGAKGPLANEDPRRVQLQRLAARISVNRVVAGVHFPVDNISARALGETLGEHFVARCDPNRGWTPRRVAGAAIPPAEAFDPSQQRIDAQALRRGDKAYYELFGNVAQLRGSRHTASLASMWDAARAECAHLRAGG